MQAATIRTKPIKVTNLGVGVGLLIMGLWTALLAFNLTTPISWASPLTWALFLLQTHLYTGLFITSHDAMHGLVGPNRTINRMVGTACSWLFAFNWFPRLLAAHKLHHRHAGTENDPDYHKGSFWPWYWSFLTQYLSLWQFLAMAITFNIAKLVIPAENLILFWMAPAILSTFQLFYFGTYQPHKGEFEDEDPHKARSQAPNHLYAFITCYFFGYHHEHHAQPWQPWYKLPATRTINEE